MSPPEKKIYLKELSRFSDEQIDEGFQRALHECSFMPKIAEIESRMSPERTEGFAGRGFVPVKDWYEPYTKTAKLHIWEDARGQRRVMWEKYRPGEFPPRVSSPYPCDDATLAEAYRKIKDLAREKSF
jgi:hypothetical protein